VYAVSQILSLNMHITDIIVYELMNGSTPPGMNFAYLTQVKKSISETHAEHATHLVGWSW